MLEIFRKNIFINVLLLLPYVIAVRIGSIIHPSVYTITDVDNIMFVKLLSTIPSPLAQSIFCCVVIYIQVLLINRLSNQNRLASESTFFAGVVYVLLTVLIESTSLMTPVLIANTFILLALINIFETYKLPTATTYIFNTGLFLGLASLFYYPYFLYIIFGIIALLILRSFRFLEKIQYILGIGVVYFLLYTYKYLMDIPFTDFTFIQKLLFSLPTFSFSENWSVYVSIIIIAILLVIVLIRYDASTRKKSIQNQKKIDIIYWMMLFGLISLFIFQTQGFQHIHTMFIPMSLILGMAMSDSKKILLYELIHVLILGYIFIIYFDFIVF